MSPLMRSRAPGTQHERRSNFLPVSVISAPVVKITACLAPLLPTGIFALFFIYCPRLHGVV
jgi:hypothetical protein